MLQSRSVRLGQVVTGSNRFRRYKSLSRLQWELRGDLNGAGSRRTAGLCSSGTLTHSFMPRPLKSTPRVLLHDAATNGDEEEPGCVYTQRKRVRNNKHTSHTPLVADALLTRGYDSAVPYQSPIKTDFQYVSPFYHALVPGGRASLRQRTTGARINHHLAHPNLSHKSILAKFIRELHDVQLESLPAQQHEAVLQKIATVFPEAALDCLEDAGFSPCDVVSWAWILSARTSFQAAARLHAFSNRTLGPRQASYPTFLLKMILMRRTVSAKALPLLLTTALDRLGNRQSEDWKSDISGLESIRLQRMINSEASNPSFLADVPLMDRRPHPGLTETAIIVLTIRLIRHARKVLPLALPYIAQVFTMHVVGNSSRTQMSQAQRSFIYNKMLQLLSLPSGEFFRHIPYHQKAQFTIIRAMGEFDPPVLVDRFGFRSVVSVQLAHRKKNSERRWATRKAKSWPPWQEHRLGIDEDVGKDDGVSRAGRALSQLAESGYKSTSWEDAAGILSGWDTDNSPTIQTRASFPATPTAIRQDSPASESMVWAARIKATRTVEEAWSIFLSCQDEMQDSEETYFAIMEKIFMRRRDPMPNETVESADENSLPIPLPGDDPVTFQPSHNPRERPYLQTPIPSMEQLLAHAEQRGIDLDGWLLILVLERSRSFNMGRRLLKRSKLPAKLVNMVLGTEPASSSTLESLGDRLFLAVLRWHTAQFSAAAVNALHNPGQLPRTVEFGDPAARVLLAFRLVSSRRPIYSPAWTPLFRALAPPTQKPADLAVSYDAWTEMTRLIRQMDELEVDLTWGQFIYLCRTFTLTNIILYYRNSSTRLSLSKIPAIKANWNLPSALTLLKAEFEKLVGSSLTSHYNSSHTDLGIFDSDNLDNHSIHSPTILRAPKLTDLHMFIQALGLARDHKGIVDLVLWITRHHRGLLSPSDDPRPERYRRRCLSAIRAFLESTNIISDMENAPTQAASPALLEKVQQAIISTVGPDAWPTDEEVASYRPFDVSTHPEATRFLAPGRM